MGDRNEYYREYMRKYRAGLIEEMKALLGGKCVRCGDTENLQFDHIDRTTKVFTIGGAKVASRKRLLEEVAKCQLLCVEHHLEKSYEAGDLLEAQHGTSSNYSHGCRCESCTLAHRDAMRVYRAKRGTIPT